MYVRMARVCVRWRGCVYVGWRVCVYVEWCGDCHEHMPHIVVRPRVEQYQVGDSQIIVELVLQLIADKGLGPHCVLINVPMPDEAT